MNMRCSIVHQVQAWQIAARASRDSGELEHADQDIDHAISLIKTELVEEYPHIPSPTEQRNYAAAFLVKAGIIEKRRSLVESLDYLWNVVADWAWEECQRTILTSMWKRRGEVEARGWPYWDEVEQKYRELDPGRRDS